MPTDKQPAKQKALDILHQGVKQIMHSDGWKQALAFRSHFYTYSFFNTSLILAQCPDARLVAGYKKWKEQGRQVRKGEKGIAILAPLIRKNPDHPDNPKEKLVYGFRCVYVFDVSQTDGEPIPQAQRPKLLQGDSTAIQTSLLALTGFCKEQQISLSHDLAHPKALGVYRLKSHSIALKAGLPPLQQLKTFIHELAHALLHDLSSDRTLAELEAESTAFLVCHDLGLDTSQYSFAYLANWTDSLESLITAGEKLARQLNTFSQRSVHQGLKQIHRKGVKERNKPDHVLSDKHLHDANRTTQNMRRYLVRGPALFQFP